MLYGSASSILGNTLLATETTLVYALVTPLLRL
jgi:hypothetical protein